MKSFTSTYSIKAPPEKVWQALVDHRIINKWGAGPAKMNDNVGFKFSLWGGDIHGKNTKVVTNKLLVQDWYAGKWNVPSVVTIALKEEKGTTKVNLKHANIPDKEYESIKDGWDQYYFGPIKVLLEGGPG